MQVLFSAYRRDDFADPEGFLAQLGTILSEFPEEVVTYITSPQTGIQRRSKWPPTISEVLEACQQHSDFLRKKRAHTKVVPLLRAPSKPGLPGSLANVFIPADSPLYGKAVEWSKHNSPVFHRFGKSSDGRGGIWVARNAWEDGFSVPIQTQQAAE